MLRVLRPRLATHQLPGSAKRPAPACIRNERRRLSTAAEPSKPSPPEAEPGWPMKYKVAGGLVLGTVVPWMCSYAVANDPGSRRLVGKVSPSYVKWLRKRKGGQFHGEDANHLEYLARVPEWINQSVNLEVRTRGGETRRFQGVDAQTPFSSFAGLVQAEGGSGAGSGGGGGGVGWWTDFDVLDDHHDGENEGRGGGEERGGQSSGWGMSGGSPSSSSNNYDEDSSSGSNYGVAAAVRRDVAACNVQSWWDIAAAKDELARAPAQEASSSSSGWPATSAATPAGSSSVGVSGPRKMSNAEQAAAMCEHIDGMIAALEQDKLSGARSVDDVEEEVRDLRKQQKEWRGKHPAGRKKFLGLF